MLTGALLINDGIGFGNPGILWITPIYPYVENSSKYLQPITNNQ
jgi:hypothetical protein